MSHSPSFTDKESLAFPQEIIEHIIDYLHTDRTALVVCSQVSHKFYWASGYHLFSEHTINWGPKTFAEVPQRNTLERFLDCIDSLPFVATWLRSLTIQPFAGFGWINIDTGNFLTVLAKLPHLRTLCLRFLKFSSINDDPLVSATASLQSRLSLAHLEVELVDFWDVETFHRVLSSFRRIDSFQILRCFNGEAEDRTFYLPDDYRPIYPATLSIGTLETQLLDDSRDVYLLRCLGSFLRTKGNTVDSAILDISARFHPLTKMQEVGKVIRDHPEIESITIDLDTAITLHKVSSGLSVGLETWEALNLVSCHGLTTLRINTLFNAVFTATTASAFHNLLTYATSCTSLRKVVLVSLAPLWYANRNNETTKILDFVDWRAWNDSLSRFQNVEIFEIQICDTEFVNEIHAYLLRRDFPMFHQGRLRLTTGVANRYRRWEDR